MTKFGLLVVVGSAVLVAAAVLIRRRRPVRAVALVSGLAITWVCVWITKALVDRPRPPHPLVHTTGQSYPSGHSSNAVGWLALALAIAVLLPTKGARIAAIAAGALLAVLVGLSRIYLRAHYITDVLAGEAVAVAVYSLVAIAALAWTSRAPRNQVPPEPLGTASAG